MENTLELYATIRGVNWYRCTLCGYISRGMQTVCTLCGGNFRQQVSSEKEEDEWIGTD